jgi:hypothetical protein
MDMINKKSLQQIQEERKEKNAIDNADIWEAIATMGADLSEALEKISTLENRLSKVEGGVK